MLLKDFVAELEDDKRRAIINSFEEFELNGFCGDTPVRQSAVLFMEKLGMGSPDVVFWMRLLTFECYRYYFKKYCNHQV